jgi:hypothetical protein
VGVSMTGSLRGPVAAELSVDGRVAGLPGPCLVVVSRLFDSLLAASVVATPQVLADPELAAVLSAPSDGDFGPVPAPEARA